MRGQLMSMLGNIMRRVRLQAPREQSSMFFMLAEAVNGVIWLAGNYEQHGIAKSSHPVAWRRAFLSLRRFVIYGHIYRLRAVSVLT